MAVESSFAEQEEAAGAAFGERFGVKLPEHFGDSAAEYETVRKAVGLVDLSFRGLIELTGGDRLRWLNGQISNDVKDLRAGEGKLAAVLNIKGHILADLAVYGLPESVWLDLPRQRAQIVRDALDRYIVADDVAAGDASHRYAHLLIAGPKAPRLMSEAAGSAVAALPAWHHAEARLHDIPARIIATGWLARPGYDVVVPAGAAAEAWEALVKLGARPAGMAALELLRVEAGWPWYGVDFDESHLLMEALTRHHVSLTKGCYLGQEVVVRIEHQGHLNKKLMGLLLSGEAAPPAGADILSGDRKVGTVTSAVFSPALKRPIALGYVRRECWDPGTRLRVLWNEHRCEAEVTPLPFVASV